MITVGPDGNLWFTESPGNRIGRIGVDVPVVTPTPTPTPTPKPKPKPAAKAAMHCTVVGGTDRPKLKVACRVTVISASSKVRWKVARLAGGKLVDRGHRALHKGRLVINLSRVAVLGQAPGDPHQGVTGRKGGRLPPGPCISAKSRHVLSARGKGLPNQASPDPRWLKIPSVPFFHSSAEQGDFVMNRAVDSMTVAPRRWRRPAGAAATALVVAAGMLATPLVPAVAAGRAGDGVRRELHRG